MKWRTEETEKCRNEHLKRLKPRMNKYINASNRLIKWYMEGDMQAMVAYRSMFC